MALGFYFDMASCIGCKTCQIACKDKNDLPIGNLFRQIHSYEVGTYPNVNGFHWSATCNHCENPACVDACVMRCLEFGDLEELKAKHADQELVNELPAMPAASHTQPNILIHPRECAKDAAFIKVVY